MPFRSNKPARLEKQRTYDNSGPRSSPARYDDIDDTSLRSPNRFSIQNLSTQQLVTRQKQLLLRQLSDTAVDTRNGQDRPFRNAPFDPKESTSTVNTIVNDIEARTRLDVEQAIGLLQELKKVASPDELVALHRALLPVKEDTSPPATNRSSTDERAYTSVPPERRRSLLPPGLATRSGASEDPLRKQSDPSSIPTASISPTGTWTPDKQKDQPRNDSPSRLSIRSEQPYCHAGAFPSGTLRITNGAASPEPSIISKLASESNDTEQGGSVASSVHPLPSLPSLRDRRSEDVGSSRPYRSQAQELQKPETHRPTGPRPGSLDLESREQSKVRTELRLDPPLQRRSFDHIPSTQSEDVPRFQQRWSHRAAFLSQEYALDCDITESPYEEKTALSEPGRRLSTVHDEGESDVGSTCEVESRADALSKLTGVSEEAETGHQTDVGTSRSSDESGPASRTATAINAKVVRKMDSGYCSDASTSPLQRNSIAEAGQPKNAPAIQEQPSPSNKGSDPYAIEQTSAEDTPLKSTTNSSYLTFDDMVKSSPQSDTGGTWSPSQSSNKKSTLSLFKPKPKPSKKSSFHVLSVHHGERPMTSDGLVHRPSEQSARPDSKDGSSDKPKKKLQKPMPDSIRRERKKAMEELKAAKASPSLPIPDLPIYDTMKQEAFYGFVGCQAKESPEAYEMAEAKSQSLRKRSKSFAGRRQSGTLDHSDEPQEGPDLPSLPVRKRSKSIANQTAPIPVDTSTDLAVSMNCLNSGNTAAAHRDRPVPVHTNFTSVARALQSNPPSPSQESKRSAPMPKRASVQGYHSVHRTGADPDDRAIADMKYLAEPQLPASCDDDDEDQPPVPPPHQTPVSAPSTAPTTPVAVGSSYSVEDRFPGWQSKAVSPYATSPPTPSSSVSSLPLRQRRSDSLAASDIPPLPELPADIAVKVSRADQMVAKKMRLSPRSSPNGSARNSLDSIDARRQLSARRMESRKKQDAERAKEYRQSALDQLNVPREEDEDSSERSNMNNGRWSVDGSTHLPKSEEQALPYRSSHDAQHSGWPGWEQQSYLWRQRKEKLAQRLEPAEEDREPEQACDSPSTPGIVVSRYITPLPTENAHNANRAAELFNDSAKKYARVYSTLIEAEDKENSPSRPTKSRADSFVSTTTSSTTPSFNGFASRMDLSRPSSALSSYTTTTTVSSATSWSNRSNARSPFNHDRQHQMRSKDARSLPYRPSESSLAERSRASMSSKMASSETLNVPSQRPELKKRSSESLFDRYGGGMAYGWDRNSGFVGSAGTRSGKDTEAQDNRKSVKMSEDFGLDLSDIPVFLQKGASFARIHHG